MNSQNRMNWLIAIVIAVLAALAGYQLATWRQTPVNIESQKTSNQQKPAQINTEINIAQADIESSNIKIEAITEGNVASEILAPATIAPIPGGEATIIARASGPIVRINKRLGDPVKVGEVVAIVDSLEATSMTAERQTAAAKAELARKSFERESGLFGQGVTPRQDMEAAQSALSVAEAEAAKANMMAKAAKVTQDGHSIFVTSPVEGRITAETAVLGAFVQPNSELFRVANNDQLQIEAYVTASDVLKIRPGDKATVIARAGQTILANVRSVTPTVSSSNQSATVVLLPESRSLGLVIGEGVQVRLHTTMERTPGLLIPEDAIQNLDGREVVFVRTEKGFKPQPVVVGTRSGGYAQILSGIDKGTAVATTNAFLIKAEMIKSATEEE